MQLIDSYIILNRKINKTTLLFVIITIIFILSLIIISQFKYKKYYFTIGQVIKENNEYRLVLYLDPYKLNVIKNNQELYIEDIAYNYKIISIENDYSLLNNLQVSLKVYLKIDLIEKDKIENITIKIFRRKQKIILLY